MKIVMVIYYYEPVADEAALLRQYYTVTGWAEALQRKGMEVTVISRFHRNNVFRLNDVQYYFIKDGLPPAFKSWRIPYRFLKKVSALEADVVHLHQFTLSLQTFLLRQLLKKNTAIIIQHHGGKTIRSFKMRIHNFLNRVADGYFFTTAEQGKWWFGEGSQPARVMTVMEGATFFNYETRDAGRNNNYPDRQKARAITGMKGKPVFLWVGRLDQNKDPVTVLDGFEMLLQHFPDATLYMIYGNEELLGEVKVRISRSLQLQSHVIFLGNKAHDQLEACYQSADYFVLGSHYEGSSYSLSEALSCGCIPVVTDIPSFRMMTNNGHLGSLWTAGDKNAFVEAALRAIARPAGVESEACIAFWQQNLSYDGIADRSIEHYKSAAEFRKKRIYY